MVLLMICLIEVRIYVHKKFLLFHYFNSFICHN